MTNDRAKYEYLRARGASHHHAVLVVAGWRPNARRAAARIREVERNVRAVRRVA